MLNFMEEMGSQSEVRRYQEIVQREHDRFAKRGPLCTLLLFSIGPAALVCQTAMDMIDTIEVSTKFKSDPESYAMEIIGATPLIIMAVVYLGGMFAQALTAKIPKLLGEGKRDIAQQVVADIMRIALVLSIIFPIGFVWAIKPFLRFAGCPDKIVDKAFRYSLPIVFGCPLLTFFNICVGFLQGIGRYGWAFLARACTYVVQVGVFTPTLLWGLNITTDYCKCSQVAAEGITTLILVVLILKGKFNLQIPVALFKNKPTRETLNTFAIAVPTLLQFISLAFPPTLVMKSMSQVEPELVTDIEATIGVWTKVTLLVATINVAFATGFLSAGGHAHGVGNNKRFLKLLGWGMLFGIVPVTGFSLFVVFKPEVMASLFLSEAQLPYAKKLLPIPFYTFPLQTAPVFGTMTLVALAKPLLPMIFSILQVVVLTVGSQLMRKYVSGHSERIMFIYCFSDLLMLLLYTAAMLYYLVPMMCKRGTEEPEYTAISGSEGFFSEFDNSTMD